LNKLLFLVMTIVIAGVSGCAQFTTNDAELAELQLASENQAQAYINCVQSEAAEIYSTTDPGFIRDAVTSRCEDEQQAFVAAEKKALGAQYMMIDKHLKASVEQLDDRARIELAETLLARPATPANPASAPVAPMVAVAASTKPIAWNEQQRIYLDCMEDQADKYSSLNESAEAISDVPRSVSQP
jgi:hypothetical protein